MKFRKKPVVIDAIQYDGDNYEEIKNFTDNKVKIEKSIGGSEDGGGYPQLYVKLTIPTLEGVFHVRKGDWIIKGVRGEFYPCKPDIFQETYEEVRG